MAEPHLVVGVPAARSGRGLVLAVLLMAVLVAAVAAPSPSWLGSADRDPLGVSATDEPGRAPATRATIPALGATPVLPPLVRRPDDRYDVRVEHSGNHVGHVDRAAEMDPHAVSDTTRPAPLRPDADLVALRRSVEDPGGPPAGRVAAALAAAVPGAWREAVPIRLSIRSGSQSRAYTDGEIQVAIAHASGEWSRLVAVAAHEFAHQIAFRHGTGAHLGAPPAGWGDGGPLVAEAWADCVAAALTGYQLRSYGIGPCEGQALDSAAAFLAAGPSGSG